MFTRVIRCAVPTLLTGLIGLALPLVEGTAQPPAAPKVAFILKDRHGHAIPIGARAAHTGGGNTDIIQPRIDTLIITMTGVATAAPYPIRAMSSSVDFDLQQDFAVVIADPKVKKAKLTLEAQVVGLLRGDPHGGTAGVDHAAVAIHCANVCILASTIEGHTVAGRDHLSINDRKGPVSIPLPAGDFHLTQNFRIDAAHTRGICGKAAAAEFAPNPALDPTWINAADPFRGADKKDFGFRVIVRLEPAP